MNDIIAVTIGDIKGIGIQILIDIWIKKKIRSKFILFTNYKLIKNYLKKEKIKINIFKINKQIEKLSTLDFDNYINVYDIKTNNNIENTYLALKESYRLTKLKYFIGIVTLPINKRKIIINIDQNFLGQTEFFQKMDKKNISNMMFVNKKLIFFPLTNHIPLKKVINKLKIKNFIFHKIIVLYKTLNIDFNIKNPKIFIAGVNPHAGENGLIGNEEIYIKKVLLNLKKSNININGPYSADSILSKKNILKADAFIFNYHDQALIPFKLLDNFSGINYTGGLSIIRVSPDHGTAYDLVGTNKANSKSLINCFKYINIIFKNRNKFASS